VLPLLLLPLLLLLLSGPRWVWRLRAIGRRAFLRLAGQRCGLRVRCWRDRS
jgi:hypothetical protein